MWTVQRHDLRARRGLANIWQKYQAAKSLVVSGIGQETTQQAAANERHRMQEGRSKDGDGGQRTCQNLHPQNSSSHRLFPSCFLLQTSTGNNLDCLYFPLSILNEKCSTLMLHNFLCHLLHVYLWIKMAWRLDWPMGIPHGVQSYNMRATSHWSVIYWANRNISTTFHYKTLQKQLWNSCTVTKHK